MHFPTPTSPFAHVTQPIVTDLSTAISALYHAPLEDFIKERDALAKVFRDEKRKDDVALVKALRKPSRMAWTLDGVLHEDAASIDHLDAAIAAAQTGADFRSAVEAVKQAVRAVAAAGARIAVRAGHPLDPNSIATAVFAIIGDAAAFAEFRTGRLVDVPHGGGLDLLSALTAIPPSAKAPAIPKAASDHDKHPPTSEVSKPAKPDPRVALAAKARAELHRIEKSRSEVRRQSQLAVDSLRDARVKLDAAEAVVAKAQSELATRQDEFDNAQQRAEAVATELEEAEQQFEAAQSRLANLA